MDKVDRDKSVFENQKEDVQRLLGLILDNIKARTTDYPPDVWENAKIKAAATDALAVLDNMEEPDAELCWVDKEPCAAGCYLCQKKPPDDVGCPRSDAMGGTGNDRHRDSNGKAYYNPSDPPETITEEQAAAGLEKATGERVFEPAPSRVPHTREQQLSQDLEPPEEPEKEGDELPMLPGYYMCLGCYLRVKPNDEGKCPLCGASMEGE